MCFFDFVGLRGGFVVVFGRLSELARAICISSVCLSAFRGGSFGPTPDSQLAGHLTHSPPPPCLNKSGHHKDQIFWTSEMGEISPGDHRRPPSSKELSTTHHKIFREFPQNPSASFTCRRYRPAKDQSELKSQLRSVWRSIPQGTINNYVFSFENKLKKCRLARGL